MPELYLSGCTPEPLMSYLKALGILRLVAEQADSEAQGAWRGGVFVLASTFDEAALLKFFERDQNSWTPVDQAAQSNARASANAGPGADGPYSR
jgi:CRISPR-associated protein Csx17